MATANEDPTKAAAKAPVIVDLGKKRRKLVKKLRKGSGRLMDQVQGTLQELRNAGTIAASAQPVIVVVRERRRSSRNRIWPL
jgi:hypothetical protein